MKRCDEKVLIEFVFIRDISLKYEIILTFK